MDAETGVKLAMLFPVRSPAESSRPKPIGVNAELALPATIALALIP